MASPSGFWWKVDDPFLPLLNIGRIDGSGLVEIRWRNRNPVRTDINDHRNINIDWNAIAGHPEWNNNDQGYADFVMQENGTLLEKSSFVWRKVLSYEDIDFFIQNGYMILKNAIMDEDVVRARRAILSDLQAHFVGSAVNPEEYKRMAAQSFCPDLRRNDGGTLSSLMSNSKGFAGRVVEALIGRVRPSDHPPQVAIRFPSDPRQDARSPGFSGGHIDGVPTARNGVKKFSPFTCLVGCALSEQDADFKGNLTVYPGSHHQTCRSFQRNMAECRSLWRQNATTKFPQSECELNERHGQLQLHLNAGDVVILHYMLVHCIADNRGSDLRVNCYWRMKHQEHANDSTNQYVMDLWSGFDSIV